MLWSNGKTKSVFSWSAVWFNISCGLVLAILPISSIVTPVELGKSHYCPTTIKVTHKDMGKYCLWTYKKTADITKPTFLFDSAVFRNWRTMVHNSVHTHVLRSTRLHIQLSTTCLDKGLSTRDWSVWGMGVGYVKSMQTICQIIVQNPQYSRLTKSIWYLWNTWILVCWIKRYAYFSQKIVHKEFRLIF